MPSSHASGFHDLGTAPPSIDSPLRCVIDTFLSYDWEKDILTVLLRDSAGTTAVGIFQNKIGSIIYWSRLWKEFPLEISVINASVFQGDQFIIDVHDAILNPAYLVKISDINAWTYCEAQIYANEFLGLKNPPSEPLLRGSIIHNFLARIFTREYMDKLRAQIWNPTLDTALQKAVLENWVPATILGWDEDVLIRNLHTKILPSQEMFLKDYVASSSPQDRFETETMVYSFTYGLRGRLDRLELRHNHTCNLIETKTGKPTLKAIAAAENQALAYYLSLKDVRGLEVEKLLVEFPLQPLDKRMVEKVIDIACLHEIITIRNRIYGTLHGMKPFILERDACRSCFNQEICQFLCFLRQKPATLTNCNACKRYCVLKDAIGRTPSLVSRLYLIQQYYLFFIAFIRISERGQQEQRESLNLSLELRIGRGTCLGNLGYAGMKADQGGVILDLIPPVGPKTSGSIIRQGDFVFVSSERAKDIENNATRGIVRLVTDDELHVFLPGLQEVPPELRNKDEKIALDLVPQEIVEAREKIGLEWLIRGSFYPHLKELEHMRDVILLSRAPQHRKFLPAYLDEEISRSQFDESQKSAIQKALQSRDIFCIQGPPGTGKTTVICEIIRLIVEEIREKEAHQGTLSPHRGFQNNDGSLENLNINLRHLFSHHRTPVIVSAFTNRAVDNIVVKLVRDYPALKVIRVGNVESIQDPIAKSRALETLINKDFKFADGTIEHLPSPQIAQFILNYVDVVAVTSTSAGNPLCQQMCFHAAIIDEAGQITEPSTLIPATLAERVILVGDQTQLPPVVDVTEQVDLDQRGINALKQIGLHPRTGYAKSLFERLMDRWNDTGYSSLLRFQYRMNAEIAHLASDLFYGGKIQTGGGPEVAMQNVGDFFRQHGLVSKKFEGISGEIYDPEKSVIFLDISDSGVVDSFLQDSTGPHSRYNSLEAQIIAEFCISPLIQGNSDTIDGLSLIFSNIGIITTYRAQVQEITRQIEQSLKKRLSFAREDILTLLDELEIDTVDRFQGREKEIVMISLVDSNPLARISSLTAETRRFNVALTRAKKKAILIGNAETLTNPRQGDRPKNVAAKHLFQKLITTLVNQNAMLKIDKV